MTETARLAVFHGTGKPFEIREYPVPDPEPGAMLIKIALANVCGSDMHYWRGEQDYAKMGRPLPLNTGHEHVGTVAKLGPGVTGRFELKLEFKKDSTAGQATVLGAVSRSGLIFKVSPSWSAHVGTPNPSRE